MFFNFLSFWEVVCGNVQPKHVQTKTRWKSSVVYYILKPFAMDW